MALRLKLKPFYAFIISVVDLRMRVVVFCFVFLVTKISLAAYIPSLLFKIFFFTFNIALNNVHDFLARLFYLPG